MRMGFLDREGKLYPCTSYDHMWLAKKLVTDMNVEVRNGLDAEEYLQNLGWIVVRARDVYGLIGYLNDNGKEIHLTDKQKNWLLDEYAQCNSDKQSSIDELFDRDKY